MLAMNFYNMCIDDAKTDTLIYDLSADEARGLFECITRENGIAVNRFCEKPIFADGNLYGIVLNYNECIDGFPTAYVINGNNGYLGEYDIKVAPVSIKDILIDIIVGRRD